MTQDRFLTGLPGLDPLIGGGLPARSAILLSGGPGTGKTLMALKFLLAGAQAGDRCCYVSLSETKDELLRACASIEALRDVHKYLDKNLVFKHIPIGEKVDVDYFVNMFASYPPVDRLVIDNVTKLLIFAETKREYRIRLAQLLRSLKQNVSCTLLVCETEQNAIDTGNGEAFECDGVMQLSFLELEEQPLRTLQIHKMRYTAFQPKVRHELAVTAQDITLSPTKIL